MLGEQLARAGAEAVLGAEGGRESLGRVAVPHAHLARPAVANVDRHPKE